MDNLRVLPIKDEFKSVNQFKAAIKSALSHAGNEPLLVLFREMVMGKTPIPRSETKKLVREISEILPPETHVFFAASEKSNREGSRFSNTGYIVSPAESGKAKWVAYPKMWAKRNPLGKITISNGDVVAAELLAGNGADKLEKKKKILDHSIDRAKHWKRRAFNLQGNYFPEITVRGKRVSLVVCNDFDNLDARARTADIVLVSSRGINASAVKTRLGRVPKNARIVFAHTNERAPFVVKPVNGKRTTSKIPSRKIHRI